MASDLLDDCSNDAAEATVAAEGRDILYRTKMIQFLGRSTPIVLQNDNGPCPLLAICNVLLLRNNLNLSLDASEVSLQKLLSLVAERLIDSNSNLEGTDDEFANNQQQNISDAIDLLPRLATGIDVNVLFRKINDFEFTRECAIFDLLDIGLYHGWIVDPQDSSTAVAIGSKSYNTLVGELVAFEAEKSEEAKNSVMEEDDVDFAAATAATLGVPSPNLSRVVSFEDSPRPITSDHGGRKGDLEEAEDLMKALNLSISEMSNSVEGVKENGCCSCPEISNESLLHKTVVESEHNHQTNLVLPLEGDNRINDRLFSPPNIIQTVGEECTFDIATENYLVTKGSGDLTDSSRINDSIEVNVFGHEFLPSLCLEEPGTLESHGQDDQIVLKEAPSCSQTLSVDAFSFPQNDSSISSSAPHTLKDREDFVDISEGVTSSLEGSEPIYEGEECILDFQPLTFEDQEPVYEGEAILAEQADKLVEINRPTDLRDQLNPDQWLLVKNFLESNASQLTIFGLFSLQEGLKERELCVFFRNNHFSTMFKFNGELYLLATDQGYINQPDLVWEKLNEVNGDTVFMTGNFTEFKAVNQASDSWNEQNVLTNTADYIASLEVGDATNSSLNSDLQLAIALQQQEFDNQSQRPQPQISQPPPPVTGRPRLVTGPQVPARPPQVSQKNESKKDKCSLM